MKRCPIFFLALAVLCSMSAANEPRQALVIGNGAYEGSARLTNPVNDAQLMASALEACGFQTTLVLDRTLEQMEGDVRAFGETIRVGGAAFFYYAGHGLQVNGENYLLPVNAQLNNEYEVRHRCLAVDIVLAALQAAGTTFNFVVLDACRDNPFTRSFSRTVASRGLSVQETFPGTIISYATAPGTTAEDGAGENSTFTATLASYIRQPGLEVAEVFRRTQLDVTRRLSGKQQPYLNQSPIDYFYFLPGNGTPTPVPAPSPTPTAPPPAPEAPAMVGYLQVAVNAPNAKVWVDGREQGLAFPESALNITDLAVGEVTVKVEAEGYESAEKRVRIAGGTWAQEAFELMRKVLAPPPPSPPPPSADLPPGTERTFAGIEMVWIPPGEFMMGGEQSPEEVHRLYGGKIDWYKREHPRHQVRISKGFWLGKYPVTQAQWQAVMGTTVRQQRDKVNPEWPMRGEGDRYPMYYVSWDETQEFLRKLNGRGEGMFRLPTEAEWEYACRAGTKTAYYFGNDPSQLGAYAWYTNNSDAMSHTVGQKRPNAWGLYDIHGNVWEWCQDWFGEYPSGAVTDRRGSSSGSHRVARGGGWDFSPWFCRSALRGGAAPGGRGGHLGFRLALPAVR